MGRSEAGAGVCPHAGVCLAVTDRNHCKHLGSIALYWWIFMPLMSISVFMWNRCCPIQNLWVHSSRHEPNEAEWNMCFAWNMIELKHTLIALPHHSTSTVLCFYPHPMDALASPAHFTSNCPWSPGQRVHQKSFFPTSLSSQIPQVAAVLLQPSTPDTLFPTFMTLIIIFYYPPSHP